MDEWKSLVAANKALPDADKKQLSPLAEGGYLPSPFASLEMARACEVNSHALAIPGQLVSLRPYDPFQYVVIGKGTEALGWLQYIQYIAINGVARVNYAGYMQGVPYINRTNIFRFENDTMNSVLSDGRNNNPDGFQMVIVTDHSVMDTNNEEKWTTLMAQNGVLFYKTTIDKAEALVNLFTPYFMWVKAVYPAYTSYMDDASVYIVCKGYGLQREKTYDVNTTMKIMLARQRAINKRSAKIGLQSFLTIDFPTWFI